MDAFFNHLLERCANFAERHITMSLRDLLKYDSRTRAGKRARAQMRLRLALATDEELEEIARLEVAIIPEVITQGVKERLGHLKEVQARIRKEGIKRSELEAGVPRHLGG